MVPHIIYGIIFVMLFFFTIFPTAEMESVGLTVDHLCSRYLSADTDYVMYQLKSTSVKLLIHAAMPFIYVLFIWLMMWANPDEMMVVQRQPSPLGETVWDVFCTGASTLLIVAAVDTKIIIRSNAISTLVVTESWIIKTNMYVHNIIPQSEALLYAYKIDTKEVITDTLESAEFVNIGVKPQQQSRIKPFIIRINVVHIKDLRDRLQQPILVMPSVQFRTLTERFVEAFKEEVAQNPTVPSAYVPDDGDCCLACLQAQPDVKIAKYCLDVDAAGSVLPEQERCQPCGCRPLWCVSCLATWFASQQQRAERDTWLSKKTTCPMCRARFCVRDVCYLEGRRMPSTQEGEEVPPETEQ
uniref:Uncharacterized protein n=1 Tax=Anopheles melas TaxID=34690 RepID=A0A182TWR6_9DIPT